MDRRCLEQLFSRLKQKTVLVVGDFFLDRYLMIDPAKDEPSLETGLTAYQVVEVRNSPGAAGSVADSLAALEIGHVMALSLLGDDGAGYDLRRELHRRGINTEAMIIDDRLRTPTYTKPMRQQGEGDVELNRLDIKNFSPTPPDIVDKIAARLAALAPKVDGIAVIDQVAEAECGVVTTALRQHLTQIAQTYPDLPIIVDSRARAWQYRNVMLTPNAQEVLAGRGGYESEEVDDGQLAAVGQELYSQAGRPVFITLGSRGQLVITKSRSSLVPTIFVPGPIDVVGAGDSAMAGILAALMSQREPIDAAKLGNVTASITIQKLGTTGTASPAEVLAQAPLFQHLTPRKWGSS